MPICGTCPLPVFQSLISRMCGGVVVLTCGGQSIPLAHDLILRNSLEGKSAFGRLVLHHVLN